MAVQPGDEIRILRDGLQSADVKAGDVLTVTGFADPERRIVEAYDARIQCTWWFNKNREGLGFEKVED